METRIYSSLLKMKTRIYFSLQNGNQNLVQFIEWKPEFIPVYRMETRNNSTLINEKRNYFLGNCSVIFSRIIPEFHKNKSKHSILKTNFKNPYSS